MLLPLSLIACTGGLPLMQTPKTTSYVRDIQPLVERSCQGCHVSEGVAPLALETPEQAMAAAPLMWAAIESGRMPPFFAAKSCNSYQDDLRFTDDEKALFKAWFDAQARHAAPVQLPTVRHDIAMSIGGAFDVRKMNTSDNYQCFVMNPGNTADLQVVGYEVAPGNVAVAHHFSSQIFNGDSHHVA